MTQTKKCIRCDKKAKLWTGYVLKRDGGAVLAGWCSDRCWNKWVSYYGPFKKKHGEEKA